MTSIIPSDTQLSVVLLNVVNDVLQRLLQSGARDGYAKLKPTIVAAKKRVGDNIKMACEEKGDQEPNSASQQQQNGKQGPML